MTHPFANQIPIWNTEHLWSPALRLRDFVEKNIVQNLGHVIRPFAIRVSLIQSAAIIQDGEEGEEIGVRAHQG